MDKIPIGPWIPWLDRKKIANCDRPGVYLLGKFEHGIPPVVDAGASEV